jgi:hypothetical protein
MKILEDLETKILIEKVYDLIATASIELGHRTDGKSMALLAKTFSADLQRENSFKRLYLMDVATAFRNGVRLVVDKQFINIPTFYKWMRKQKELINIDIYNVETLKIPIAQAPLYRDTPKIKLIIKNNLDENKG